MIVVDDGLNMAAILRKYDNALLISMINAVSVMKRVLLCYTSSQCCIRYISVCCIAWIYLDSCVQCSAAWIYPSMLTASRAMK